MFGYLQHEMSRNLERIDFFRFSREFIQVLHVNIPTIQSVGFVEPISLKPAIGLEEDGQSLELQAAQTQATATGLPVLTGATLFLPFPVQGETVLAEAQGLDDYLIRKISSDWLNELLPRLLREFLLLKRANIDSLTGLLSSFCLEEYLDTNGAEQTGALILVSVYPKGGSSFYAQKYQHRVIGLLKYFVKAQFPLYSLGQSCFAMVCEGRDSGFAADFAPSLVSYLKREHCYRVHVSTVLLGGNNIKHTASKPISETLTKLAYSALHMASRRGPFSFCNASALENSEEHPLSPPSENLRRWILRVARKYDAFSVLQFEGDRKILSESIAEKCGEEGHFISRDDVHYMCLPTTDTAKLKSVAQNVQTACADKSSDPTNVNVGISIYSGKDSTRTAQLLNCRRALCHAAFLDPGSVVFCDAVSFNVSGDIYYGDGDLVRAVRDYKKGLQLAPEEGILLNSLGVCFAQMNRHKDAVACFQKACRSEEDRFMALYNLGLEQQIQKESFETMNSYDRALACPENDGQTQARKDISFQLAVLCTQAKQYNRALELLLPWFRNEEKVAAGGKALRYLGEIYGGLGQNRKAMKYLQRAMRYDEYDAEVLGLLGEIYLLENEGDDIALRFCEKAVELSPDSLPLKIRLAKAQIQCGDLGAVAATLQPCLRAKKTRHAAMKQRGFLALEQGKKKVAQKWFEKADNYILDNMNL